MVFTIISDKLHILYLDDTVCYNNLSPFYHCQVSSNDML